MKKFLFFVTVLSVAACSSGGGGSSSSIDDRAVSSAAQSESPGGFWLGADSSDRESAMLVEESGRYYFLAGLYEGGSGLLTVVNRDYIQGSLSLPRESGVATPDGGSSDNCNLKGSLVGRELMTLEVRCRTEGNQQVLTNIALAYDPVYERDSALSTLAGLYNFRPGLVLDINANGTIFGQDSVSGCVIDGQASIANTDYNLYGFNWGLIDCVGPDVALNGERFRGFALLNNTVSPEQLVVAMSRSANNEATTSNTGSTGTIVDDAQTTIIVFADRL